MQKKQSSRLRKTISKPVRTKPKILVLYLSHYLFSLNIQKIQLKRFKQSQLRGLKLPSVQPKVFAKPPVQVKPIKKKQEIPIEKSKFGFTISDFEQIPSIPVYKCSEAEFKDPMKLLRELRRLGYEDYGCVKLIPPKSFKSPFCFNGKGRAITTRKQVLQELSRAEVAIIL